MKEQTSPQLSYNRQAILFLLPIFAYFAFLVLSGQGHRVHLLFFGSVFFLYFFHEKSRYLILLALPFLIKNLMYDALRWIPFDFLRPIHVEGPYLLEKALFGITTSEGRILLTDYLSHWRNIFFDFYTGLLYALVDLYPLATILLLWRRRGAEMAWRFSIAYFVMNLFAFATYIFYPVAPPWYVQPDGLMEPSGPDLGSSAGLQWFEQILGISAISNTYTLNPVVFGAIPSMHVGYACCISFYLLYALPKKYRWTPLLYIVSVSFGAIYLGHHYMIDVLAGIIYPGVAIFVAEKARRFSLRLFRSLEPIFASTGLPLIWERVAALAQGQQGGQEEESG